MIKIHSLSMRKSSPNLHTLKCKLLPFFPFLKLHFKGENSLLKGDNLHVKCEIKLAQLSVKIFARFKENKKD